MGNFLVDAEEVEADFTGIADVAIIVSGIET